MSSVPWRLGQCFKTDHYYLLITGEGLYRSLECVSAFLATHPEVSQVINVGVVGALADDLTSGSCFQVRTVYGHGDQLQFQSYSGQTDLQLPRLDCLSVDFRVKDVQQKKELSVFAPLVDRELWSLARAAQLFGLPWTSVKVVADELTQQDFCQSVMDQAADYSQKLYQASQSLWQSAAFAASTTEEMQFDHFHLTFTQKKQFEKLKKRIDSQQGITDLMGQLAQQKMSKKMRTQKLLAQMQAWANPFITQFQKSFEPLAQDLNAAGIDLHLNYQNEKKPLEFRFSCENQEDLARKKKALADLDLSFFDQQFHGEL